MTISRFCLLLICLLAVGAPVKAKRMAPKPVDPVVYKQVKYTAPHFVPGEAQKGGFVEARNLQDDKLLWRVKIYSTHYTQGLESDVQDVFIVSLSRQGDSLIIENERQQRYSLDMHTQKVKAL